MKNSEEIKKLLREYMPELEEKFKVKQLWIFGSYSRGEQKKSSDLDLLVEFSETPGLFKFIDLEDFLTDKLGIKTELVTKDALKPRIKDKILNEAQYT